MSESESSSAVVLELAEEFLERYRKGERPPLKEYVDRHPELAAEIKEVFPAMAMMENIALADESMDQPAARGRTPVPSSLERLGDYRIIREIGHGGMGVVYEAEQVSLGRHVALKLLPNHALQDDKQKRRFEREARAAAKLHHTNIVPVFGVGEHDGVPYYVMQFIQGLGLDAVLEELQRVQPGAEAAPNGMTTGGEIRIARRDVSAADMARSLMTGAFRPADDGEEGNDAEDAGHPTPVDATQDHSAQGPPALERSGSGRLSDSFTISSSTLTLPASSGTGRKTAVKKQTYWQSVANIGRQVAEGLEYAHKQGILHRDVKPSNLLLDLRGTVWVTDFGLAKVAGPDAENITHTGDILGTLRYMPPEAFEGKSDARGDVYSLGLTLYELLAMRPAFDEKDRNKLIKQVTSGEPAALDKVRREVPRDLVTIVQKSIAREPSRRYATAEDLAADLQRFLEDEPIQARRQTQLERYVRWARHNPGIAVLGGALTAVLVLATIASLFVANSMSNLASRESQAAADERQARRLAVDAQEREAEQRRQAEQAERNAEESRRRTEEALKSARQAEAEARDRAAAEAAAKALAQRETQRAEVERKRAEEQLTRAEWLVYAGKLMLAQTDFEAGNGGLGLHYLKECAEKLRGWEHRYLSTRINAKQTLMGHKGDVWSVAFSTDGTRIVTGSEDGTAKLWDAATGKEVLALRGHKYRVIGVAFSPDGNRVVTGAGPYGAGKKPNETKVWDTRTGKVLLDLAGHKYCVCAVAFSPDGKHIATGAGDWAYGPGEAKVWDAATGQALLDLKGHTNGVRCVAFSPDGKRIVTGSHDGAAKVWDAVTGQPILALKGRTESLSSVAFSPDGTRIITGGGRAGLPLGKVKFWDAETGREVDVIEGHVGHVSSVAFSPDGKRVVTGSWDMTVKVWDTRTGSMLLILKGHAGHVLSVAYSPDGKRIVAGGQDKTARVWDAEKGQEIPILKHKNGVSSIAFSPDSSRFVTGSLDSTAKVWDAATGREVFTLKMHPSAPKPWTVAGTWCVAFSPDGKRIATGCQDKTTKIWDAETGRELLAVKGHAGGVRSVAFSPDGKRIATASPDRTARVWDAEAGRELLVLKGHAGWVSTVAFSPDGTRIVTGSLDRMAKVWDAATGRELLVLQGHAGGVSSVAFSPDGARIVTGSHDGMAKMWDAAKGRELLAFRGHGDKVTSVAMSPDGKRIVTGSNDRTAKLWDADHGFELLSLKGHTNHVLGVAFSPDGNRIVTGIAGERATAKIWYAATGQDAEDETWPLPDAAERIRYHTEQAALAMPLKQWFAAEFHLRRVLRDDPENTAGKTRLALIPCLSAYDQKKFALAARLWAEALDRNPKLGDDRRTQHRYNAACAAALAAAGQGKEEPPLDDAAKANLRKRALQWLRTELTVWTERLASGPPQERPAVLQTLGHWRKDPDLAGIRDAAALAELPADERKAFTQLWADAAALLKKAETEPK